jgi:hypothetical protein
LALQEPVQLAGRGTGQATADLAPAPALAVRRRLLYDVGGGVLSVTFPLVVVAATGSLVMRFWRARGVERQQLR